ncbi:MAG: coproporphyrinogen dehydrogenase HemZ [Ruminococcus sp.]|nr:coproporphyrinogen dehydrogenase HemZ [Ruminococcus sp.]
MRLIYVGNDFKYDTEAVMKLFLPAERFEFSYCESLDEAKQHFDGDCAMMVRTVGGEDTELSVEVQLGGRRQHEVCRFPKDITDDSCKIELSKELYTCMSKLTGISSKWGVLTGVRPVKQVHKLTDAGCGKDEVFAKLRESFLVSEEKSRIAWETAVTQRPLLEETARRGRKSFGLYVSIPFCPTRCSYCSFISMSAQGSAIKKLIPPYIENLCDEIRYTGRIARELGLTADSVYFGGGTPTTLSAAQLTRIMTVLEESFDLSKIREYTIEAGRPDTVTAEKLSAIREKGCTRVSINPQTLNDEVLKTIGRSHSTELFYEAFRTAREAGFDTINTDIIAGLPSDTLESFRATIDGLIELSPENITVHTLSVKRSSNLNMEDGKSEVFDNPASEMVEYANEKLSAAGYRPYYLYRQKNMVDNLENIGWAKPGHESVYNICIMEEVQTILAMGAVGSTKLLDTEDGRLERIFNYKYPQDYNNNFQLMLKRKDRIREFYAEKE